VVRAGIEPATHGFSVRQRPNEFIDETNDGIESAHKRAHLIDQRLKYILDSWPTLTETDRDHLFKSVLESLASQVVK
jgi:hypothetical protein